MGSDHEGICYRSEKNYAKLSVDFDLWKGESDADPYIPKLVDYLKEKGYAYMDQGALVVV